MAVDTGKHITDTRVQPTAQIPQLGQARWRLWLALAIGLVIILGVTALMMSYQPHIKLNNGLGWDGRYYQRMTQQLLDSETIRDRPPWVNRFGSVWLAATFTKISASSIDHSYWLLNEGSALLLILLLSWVGFRQTTKANHSRLLSQVLMVLIPLGWWSWHWLSPFRFSAFDPYNADTVAMLLLFVGILLQDWINGHLDSPHHRTQVGLVNLFLAGVIFLGCLCREFVLALPLALLIGHLSQGKAIRYQQIPIRLYHLAVGVMGIMAARWQVQNTMTSNLPEAFWYHFRDMSYHLLEIRPLVFALSAWLAYGPVLIMVLILRKPFCQVIKASRYRLPLLLILLILCYVGGTDSERYLFWLSPILIYWFWLVVKLEEGQNAISRLTMAFWCLLVIGQGLASRWLMPIPEPEATQTWPHWPVLTSFGGANPFLQLMGHHGYGLNYLYTIVLLAEYGLLIGLLLWLSRSRPDPLGLKSPPKQDLAP